MPSPRRLLGPVAALAVLAAPATAHAVDAERLSARLAQESARLGGVSGAHVVEVDTGRVLYTRKADVPRIPASNQKLFTTATALLRFGPATTLTTSLRLPTGTTPDAKGVIAGDVFLVGGGDPSLDDDDLRALAAQAAKAGVKRIRGGVVGDESLFDQRRGGPRTSWRPDSDMGGWLSAVAWGHGRAYPDGPATVAAARMHLFLKQAGIKLGRKARAGRLLELPGAELATVASPPIRTLAAITNQPSDNFYAEMLVKGLGARFGKAGSTPAGLAVVRDELRKLGINPKPADGSGLSRANRATPRQLVRLLVRLDGMAVGPAFRASLARFGATGTLARRLRGTAAAKRCMGKTGTINGVSALSGYCRARDGGLVAFSFLENRVSPLSAKRREDRMVRVIANYDG